MLPDRQTRLLTGLVDGQLTPGEHNLAQELLNKSAAARAFLEQLQADSQVLAALPQAQLPDNFNERLRQSLPKRPTRLARLPVRPNRQFQWRTAALYAAAASLFLAIAVAYWQKGGKPAVGGDTVPNELTNPRNDVAVTPVPVEEQLGHPQPEKPIVKTPTVPVAGKPEVLVVMPKPDLDSIHTAPVANATRLRANERRVPIRLAMRDLEQEKPRKQIADELALAPSWRVDLRCLESEAATSRLRKAFQQQGIQLLIEPDAGDRQRLRLPNTTYAVLVENVTPAECLATLASLRQIDRQEFARSRSSNQYIDVKVGQLTPADSGRLGLLFGITPPAPAPKAKQITMSTDVDIRDKELLTRTQALIPWQALLPQVEQKPARNAFLVADAASIVHKPTNESQLFLNSRQVLKPGLLQLLIVLAPRKG